MKIFFWVLLFCSTSHAQMVKPALSEVSEKINKTLPEVWDHATRLVRTTVEHNNFYYHFVLRAEPSEFNWALPKVKAQVLKSICSKRQEKAILLEYKANIIYKYESEKGLSLGEFMIRPDHCRR